MNRTTFAGRELVKRMWLVYGVAITEHFAQYYINTESKQLATLMSRLPGVAW